MTDTTPTSQPLDLDLDAIRAPLPDDARLDAYYYGFDRTGVGVIDAVLSAVAVAGKGSHHTEGWGGQSDYEDSGYYRDRAGLVDGDSAVDLIERNAVRAAETVRALLAEVEALRTERDQAKRDQAAAEAWYKIADQRGIDWMHRALAAEAERDRLAAVARHYQEVAEQIINPNDLQELMSARLSAAPSDALAEVKAQAVEDYADALAANASAEIWDAPEHVTDVRGWAAAIREGRS